VVALKHVPFEEASFEEAQWGEGKGGIAGGGRYEGVRMGISFLDPTLLVGTRLALCVVAAWSSLTGHHVSA
jgi:hypothetical protein